MKKATQMLAVSVVVLALAQAGFGAVINVPASTAGFYVDTGLHEPWPTYPNYPVGYDSTNGVVMHDYFTFDLSGISDPVVSAVLQVVNPYNGYLSQDSSETYEIYDYTSLLDVDAGYAPGAVGQGIFADLGGGNAYGSADITSATSDVVYSISLNGTGVNDVAAASGGLMVIGGALTTLSAQTQVDEAVFAYTSNWQYGEPAAPQLIITTEDEPGPEVIPEPTTIALLGCALFGLARRRRK